MKYSIKPVAGRKVRLPDTAEILPEKGLSVTWNAYWQRRLDDGDIILVASAKGSAPATNVKTTKE